MSQFIKLAKWMSPTFVKQVGVGAFLLIALHLVDRMGWIDEPVYTLAAFAITLFPLSSIVMTLKKNVKWWVKLPMSRLSIFVFVFLGSVFCEGLVSALLFGAYRLHWYARPPSPDFLILASREVTWIYGVIGIALAVVYAFAVSYGIFFISLLAAQGQQKSKSIWAWSPVSPRRLIIRALLGVALVVANEVSVQTSQLVFFLVACAALFIVSTYQDIPDVFFAESLSTGKIRALFALAITAPVAVVLFLGRAEFFATSIEARVINKDLMGALAPKLSLDDWKQYFLEADSPANSPAGTEGRPRYSPRRAAFSQYCQTMRSKCKTSKTENRFARRIIDQSGTAGVVTTQWLVQEVQRPKLTQVWLDYLVSIDTVPDEILSAAFEQAQLVQESSRIFTKDVALRVLKTDQQVLDWLRKYPSNERSIVLGLNATQALESPSLELQNWVLSHLDSWTADFSANGLRTLATTLSLLRREEVSIRQLIQMASLPQEALLSSFNSRSPASTIGRANCPEISSNALPTYASDYLMNYCVRRHFSSQRNLLGLDAFINMGWVKRKDIQLYKDLFSLWNQFKLYQ